LEAVAVPITVYGEDDQGGSMELKTDLKSIIRRAKYDAGVQKKDMVVGTEGGRWTVRSKDDTRSDQMKPGIIVDADGIKYPEHRDLVERILAGEEIEDLSG
jgi:hypothetical protein